MLHFISLLNSIFSSSSSIWQLDSRATSWIYISLSSRDINVCWVRNLLELNVRMMIWVLFLSFLLFLFISLLLSFILLFFISYFSSNFFLFFHFFVPTNCFHTVLWPSYIIFINSAGSFMEIMKLPAQFSQFLKIKYI